MALNQKFSVLVTLGTDDRVKQRIGRILATGLVATSLTRLGTLALAGTANAATARCATSAKEYPTNGYNAYVKVKLCINQNWGGAGGGNS